MKICLISPLVEMNKEKESFQNRPSATQQDILNLIQTKSVQSCDLILLPGWAKNHPSPQKLQQAIKKNQKLFVETAYKTKQGKKSSFGTPYIISHDGMKKLPQQVFAISDEANQGNLNTLSDRWAGRAIEVAGRKVSFLLCGEINAFQRNGVARHNVELDYDILINPVHSPMGRWGILNEKFTHLSRNGGKIAIHLANNNYSNVHVTTNLRVYRCGHLKFDNQHFKNRNGQDILVWRILDVW